MVEQRNNYYSATGQQRRWTSRTIMVEQWNRYGGKVEQCWWNSGTDIEEMWNSVTEMVDQWKNYGGTEKQRWWNSGTMMVEQRNRYGGKVEQ